MAANHPSDALSDPAIQAAVNQALDPYRDVLTPEALEEMRAALAEILAIHPVTGRLARRLRERTNVVSGEQAQDGAPEIEAKRKGA